MPAGVWRQLGISAAYRRRSVAAKWAAAAWRRHRGGILVAWRRRTAAAAAWHASPGVTANSGVTWRRGGVSVMAAIWRRRQLWRGGGGLNSGGSVAAAAKWHQYVFRLAAACGGCGGERRQRRRRQPLSRQRGMAWRTGDRRQCWRLWRSTATLSYGISALFGAREKKTAYQWQQLSATSKRQLAMAPPSGG